MYVELMIGSLKIIVDKKQNRQKERESSLREFFNYNRGVNMRFNVRRLREKIFKVVGQKE